MTDQLREELARLADQAPPVHVATDTWARGRRARRRDRWSLAAGAAALLVAGGVASLLTSPPAALTPAAPVEAPGVPDRLHAVPEWIVQLRDTPTGEMSWAPEADVTSDLAVGTAAAAFAAGDFGRLPVVVTAADGRYLLLDLPGFSDAAVLNTGGDQTSALELSPDGRRLAYAWWDPTAPLDEPMPAGVRIVDLGTGEIDTVGLEGGNGVDVDMLSWSPGGRWLGWYGTATGSWTPLGRGGGDPVAGRIRADRPVSQPVVVPRGIVASIAVDDAGTVAFVADQTVVAQGRRTRLPEARPVYWNAAAFAPGSQLLAVSEQSVGTLPLLDTATGARRFVPLPGDTVGTEVAPLGWTPDGRVVTTRQVEGEDVARLALADVEGRRWSTVGEVDPALLSTLSLATDLMVEDRPTVERPDPDWPWSTATRLWLLALSVAALLVIAPLVVRRWFRLPR